MAQNTNSQAIFSNIMEMKKGGNGVNNKLEYFKLMKNFNFYDMQEILISF